MTALRHELGQSKHWLSMLSIAALSVACSEDDGDGATRHTYQDQGTLCLSTGPEGPTAVTARTWHNCLSSSCDQLVSNECSVEVDGMRLIVHSTTVVDSKGGQCTADCVMGAAECQSVEVPAGTYEVVYGDQTGSIEIPHDDSFAIFDEGTPQDGALCRR